MIFFVNLGMKKSEKIAMNVDGKEYVLAVSEELNKLKGRILAPRKLAEANERLKKYEGKPLPLPK